MLALILFILIGVWAASRVLTGPSAETIGSERFTLAEAQHGSIEQSLALNTSASWNALAEIASPSSGTITEVLHANGEIITAGDALYSIDLKPVIAAQGEVPAFRTLTHGVKGRDVEQLQQLLTDFGYFEEGINGIFDYKLYWSVRAWQKDLGFEETGSVEAGAILFVPNLPARAALGQKIQVGSLVSAETIAIEILPNSPDFGIELTAGHARVVKLGMAVEIRHDEATWQAVVARLEIDTDSGTHYAHLSSADDNAICGDQCGLIPLADPTLLSSVIYVVPEVEGVTVPVAAVTTGADGSIVVVDETGTVIPVTVVAGAQGMVVVEGVEAGLKVRVPGEAGE
jgi:peptidoglycan hydrolase-like protein with peptidoglycan-binding domain